jgi:hypothetical protein
MADTCTSVCEYVSARVRVHVSGGDMFVGQPCPCGFHKKEQRNSRKVMPYSYGKVMFLYRCGTTRHR